MGSTRKTSKAKPGQTPPPLSPVADPSRDAAFFTFYSFKGGVGRTMALVNTAAILAGRGFRVLTIDLDLEAPGLSYLNAESEEAREQPGFISLIADVLEKGEAAPFAQEDAAQAIGPYVRSIPVPEVMRQFDDGALYVMPAGRLTPDYEERLQKLDLPRLYESGRGRPLVQLLKQRLIESRLFDYVLVDSRTGFSDEAGISVRDLGDRLIVIMGLNRQNALGTARFLQRLKVSGIEPKSLDIVLSPVPMGEDELYERRKEEVSHLLKDALGKAPALDLELPYHPRLALSEDPHVFGRRHDALFGAYQRLEERVRSRNGDSAGELYAATRGATERGDHDVALRTIRRLARVDRENAVQCVLAATSALAAKDSAEAGRNSAEPYYKAGMAISPRDWRLAASYATYLHTVRRDYARADRMYQVALDLAPGLLLLRVNHAIAKQMLGEYAGAEERFRQAIEHAPNHAPGLASYALFLADVRKDASLAEKLYGQALRMAPKDANTLGNYAKMLFAQGRSQEGIARLRQALALLRPNDRPLLAELHFYAYAHRVPPPPAAPLTELKRLLLGGARSRVFPLAANVERAIQDGHPEPEFLQALAAVIGDKAEIKTLEAFQAWRQA